MSFNSNNYSISLSDVEPEEIQLSEEKTDDATLARTIKPHYIDLKNLTQDTITLLQDYLDGLSIPEMIVKDLVKLASILIDVFDATSPKTVTESFALTEAARLVNDTAMSLLSEAIAELEKYKDVRELTSTAEYISTIKVLTKLKIVIERLTKEKQNMSVVLEAELSPDCLEQIGLPYEEEE